jgi:hypothetical protein
MNLLDIAKKPEISTTVPVSSGPARGANRRGVLRWCAGYNVKGVESVSELFVEKTVDKLVPTNCRKTLKTR